jgi:hypothetical protein
LKKDYILVLGSKPDSTLPDKKFIINKIYAANGSIERIKDSRLKYNIKTISVISWREFEKNIQVQTRVLSSFFNKIIIRASYFDIKKYSFKNKNYFYKHYTKWSDIFFQKEFFKYGFLSLLIGESKYQLSLILKIKHLIKIIFQPQFFGVSTGFFSILQAIHENPGSRIIVSGIGLEKGGHFYNKNLIRHNNRANVDKYLMRYLKKKYKKKLYTLDISMHTLANIPKL